MMVWTEVTEGYSKLTLRPEVDSEYNALDNLMPSPGHELTMTRKDFPDGSVRYTIALRIGELTDLIGKVDSDGGDKNELAKELGDYQKMNTDDLETLCVERGLDTSGCKRKQDFMVLLCEGRATKRKQAR